MPNQALRSKALRPTLSDGLPLSFRTRAVNFFYMLSINMQNPYHITDTSFVTLNIEINQLISLIHQDYRESHKPDYYSDFMSHFVIYL
jgi:hypothetical protein